jgi:hypothetical protein
MDDVFFCSFGDAHLFVGICVCLEASSSPLRPNFDVLPATLRVFKWQRAELFHGLGLF